jgi:flagellar motility protein MotE (MotC chaperone)
MKILILMILSVSALQVFAETKKYSEEEFIKKVTEEVKSKVDSIKKKSVTDLTKEILDKESELRLKELDLQKRKDSLKVSEDELSKKYAAFEAKQREFLGCLTKNEEESKARIGQVVEMVSNMKPQKAAEVLSVQESDIAVRILQMINPQKASKIFNFMDKEVSAKLQKQYLQMKK